MQKQLALITEVPQPRAVTHQCGEPAVEQFFFSPREQKVVSVTVCSVCHSTFYVKARLLVVGKPVQGAAIGSARKATA